MVEADQFISSYRMVMIPIVGERGKILRWAASAYCLARAIIKNPAILILDEGYSALDNHTEDMIQRSI